MEMDYYIEKYFGESSEDIGITYHETVRQLLLPEYSDLSDEEIDDFLECALAGMSPEEIEGFWSGLKNVFKKVGRGVSRAVRTIGKGIVKAAPKILPAIGTLVGGPVIGGTLGKVVGRAIGGTKRRAPVRAPAVASQQARPPIPAGGTSAAAQLLALIQNPALLQSLLAQVLGPAGRSTVRVGLQETPASFGAFMTALSELATQAAQEANASSENVSGIPAYLLDEAGNFLCEDVAVPAQRAEVLLRHLRETSLAEALAEAEEHQESSRDDFTEWCRKADWLEESPVYPEIQGQGEITDNFTEWCRQAGWL